MSTPFWGNIDSRRLARAYVALAFAQDVAKGYVKENAVGAPDTFGVGDVGEVAGRDPGGCVAGGRTGV